MSEGDRSPAVEGVGPLDDHRCQRGEDVIVPPRRFFQFEYTVRLLGDGFFGKDVEVPPLRVTLRVTVAMPSATV